MNLQNNSAPVVVGHPEAAKQNNTQPGFCYPVPAFVKPSFPSIEFLPGRVLGKLLTGRRMTHKDSWLELGHARLADSIWKLRRLGWPVRMDEEVVPTSDAGRPATIGVYFLTSDVIDAAGEQGQRYAAECARVEAERRVA
jgi:hypothetical protein